MELRKVQYKNRKFVIKKMVTKDFKSGVLVGFVVLHFLCTTFLMYYFNPYVGLNKRNKMMIISYKLNMSYRNVFFFFFSKFLMHCMG